jgi:hypothetical protein
MQGEQLMLESEQIEMQGKQLMLKNEEIVLRR